MKILDPHHPFFDRAHTRWLTTLLPLAWAVFEGAMGNWIWAAAFAAVGLYAGYVLFIQKAAGEDR